MKKNQVWAKKQGGWRKEESVVPGEKNRSSLKDEGPASGMCYDTLGWWNDSAQKLLWMVMTGNKIPL